MLIFLQWGVWIILALSVVIPIRFYRDLFIAIKKTYDLSVMLWFFVVFCTYIFVTLFFLYPSKQQATEDHSVTEEISQITKEKNSEEINQITKEKTTEQQLKNTNDTIRKLQSNLKESISPLLKKYEIEYAGYAEDLKMRIKDLKIVSHQDLIANSTKYQEENNLLHRAATLRHAIKWLKSKENNSRQALMQLIEQGWKLEKILDLKQIASIDEQQEVTEIIIKAESIIYESTKPPDKQDIASIERNIFDELKGYSK